MAIPSTTANAWIRVYTRLFGMDAIQQRGDGQGRLIPASGPLSNYLTDPLGAEDVWPGNPRRSACHPAATLNFDIAVVLPNGKARIYGGIVGFCWIGSDTAAHPVFDPGKNPTATASFQGVCNAGVLGLGSPATSGSRSHDVCSVGCRPTPHRRENSPRRVALPRAGAARGCLPPASSSGKWTGVIGGGRIAKETVCDLPGLGASPGGYGGRETIVTGASSRKGASGVRHCPPRPPPGTGIS